MATEPNQGAPGDAPAGATAYRPGESPLTVDSAGDVFDERPELFVGAAFLGGFVVAQILKRVAQ